MCDVTLVPEERQSDPMFPDVGGAIEVTGVTDVHDGIDEVPKYPETDFMNLSTVSIAVYTVVGEDNRPTTLGMKQRNEQNKLLC